MKKDIHPKYHTVEVVCACGNKFQTGSTQSEALRLEVCFKCHPQYTGKQKIVDSAGRVDRFKQRTQIAKNLEEKRKAVEDAKRKPSDEDEVVTPVEAIEVSEAPVEETSVSEEMVEEVTEVAAEEKAPVKKVAAKKAPAAKKPAAKKAAPAKKPAAKKK